MVSLELRFMQEKLEDGQLVYRLEPYVEFYWRCFPGNLWLTDPHRPVDVFVTYDGKRASDIAVSRYATRHLVAFEVSVVRMHGPHIHAARWS